MKSDAPHHKSFEDREASFWQQIEAKYGSRDGFEKFVFKSYRAKSIVVCGEHGDFETCPHQLLSIKKAVLCNKCSNKSKGERAAIRDLAERKQAFKDRVIETFGSFDGFQDFEFVNYNSKSTLHCKNHGPYQKTASKIFSGRNPCVKCQKYESQVAQVKKYMERIYDSFGDSIGPVGWTYEQVTGKGMLTVVCREHGEFKRTPSNLLSGMGCNECQGRKPYKYTTESFKRKVASVRGSGKGLGPVVYTAHNKNVLIGCDIHGVVPCYPSTLLDGGWCEKCSVEGRTKWNTDALISASKEKFPDRLTYEKTVYTHWAEKVTFNCKTHGEFKSLLDTHLRSASGCPGCTVKGYSDFKPGHFYILQSKDLVKVGITNKNPDERLNNINKDSRKGFELVTYFYFEDGSLARELESWVLRTYRETHMQPTEVFDGYTEAFYEVDLKQLIQDVADKISYL